MREEHVRRHVGVTSRTMPSAPTTRMRVPAAIGVGGAGRPVLAADVHAAGAERRVDVVRDDAFAAEERLGASTERRRRRMFLRILGRSTRNETAMTTMKSTICTGSPKDRKAATAAAKRADADEDDPEVRNRHFDDRGDERDRDPDGRPAVEGKHEERAIIAGTAPVRRAFRATAWPTIISSVARPKQMISRVRLAAGVGAFRASTRPRCAKTTARQHHGRVLDGPEPGDGIAHRRAEVARTTAVVFGLRKP